MLDNSQASFVASDENSCCFFFPPVALNFQTKGTEMDIHQGQFQDNGFCGYVLKPEFLRDEQTRFNPKTVTEGPWLTRKKLQVKVVTPLLFERQLKSTIFGFLEMQAILAVWFPNMSPFFSTGHLRPAAAQSEQEQKLYC